MHDVATACRLLEEIGPLSEQVAQWGPPPDRRYFSTVVVMAGHVDGTPDERATLHARALARLTVAVRGGARAAVPS
jgi:hypothetical protein